MFRNDNNDAAGTTSNNTKNDGCHGGDDWCLQHTEYVFFCVFFDVLIIIYSYPMCLETETTTTMHHLYQH